MAAFVPEVSFDEDWEWVPSPSSPTPSKSSFTPSDPGMMDHYSRKKLPSLPASEKNKKNRANSPGRLRATCHHGSSPSQVHEVQTTLSHVPNGPTPLQTYTEDEQSHELLALGLDLDRELLPSYRRAGQSVEDASRPRQNPRPRKRNDIVLRKKKQ